MLCVDICLSLFPKVRSNKTTLWIAVLVMPLASMLIELPHAAYSIELNVKGLSPPT
jgi:hypothetical protein